MPTAQDPQALTALAPKQLEDGGAFSGILQPKHRPNLPQVGGAPTQAQYNLLLTTLASLGLITTS